MTMSQPDIVNVLYIRMWFYKKLTTLQNLKHTSFDWDILSIILDVTPFIYHALKQQISKHNF
jgi:hypothetical protein